MLETVATNETHVSIRATVRRVGVYLDNHSMIGLAKGDRLPVEGTDIMAVIKREAAEVTAANPVLAPGS